MKNGSVKTFLKCCQCGRILRPPFQLCHAEHLVCPQCNQHQDTNYVENGKIKNCKEKVLSSVVLNKLFQKDEDICQHGCGYRNNILEIGNHEKSCFTTKRLVKCLIPYCSWFNIISNLVKHVENEHPEQLFSLADKSKDLIIGAENPTVLVTQYENQKEENLLYWLRFHQKASKRYALMMYLGQSSTGIQEDQRVTNYSVYSIKNPKLVVKGEVVTLSEACEQLVNKNIFLIDKGVYLPRYGGGKYRIKAMKCLQNEIPNSVKEDHCDVCMKISSASLEECSCGSRSCEECAKEDTEGICSNCKIKTIKTEGPYLRSKVNRSVEEITEQKAKKAKFSCKFSDAGCKVNGTKEEIHYHEEVCGLGESKCGNSLCNWKGPDEDVIDHWKKTHMTLGNKSTFVCEKDWNQILITESNNHFLLSSLLSEGSYYLSVLHLNTRKESDYRFHLDISHPTNFRKRKNFMGVCSAGTLGEICKNDFLIKTGADFQIRKSWYDKELCDKDNQIKIYINICKNH